MENEPLIIGVCHKAIQLTPKQLRKYSLRLEQIFENAKGKRRLFVEMAPHILESYKIGISSRNNAWNDGFFYRKMGNFIVENTEPFEVVVAAALKNGWKLIPLVSMSHIWRLERIQQPLASELNAAYNEMEKEAAAIVRKAKADQRDVIVMHPNHISGFLSHSKFSPRSVVFVSRPSRNMLPKPKSRLKRPSKIRQIRHKPKM
ncbi:MAG TPA: hypothetical protein VJG83_05600 [archaeon]|nr:hypothetical protein [archaeon]